MAAATVESVYPSRERKPGTSDDGLAHGNHSGFDRLGTAMIRSGNGGDCA